MSTSFGLGRFIPGQWDTLWIPRRITQKRVIYYSPPGADLAWAGLIPSYEPGLNALLTALVDVGFLVITGDMDYTAWGHDGLLTEWETFRTTGLPALLATLNGGSVVDTSKIIVGGHSQGVVDANRYAQTYPTHTKAVFNLPGAYDVQGIWTGIYRWPSDVAGADLVGLQAAIAGAWGLTWGVDPLPARADPYNNAALQAAIPTYVSYSVGDTTTGVAEQKAFAAAVGPMATLKKISDTTVHSDAEALDGLNAGLVSWLLNQAA